MSQWLAQFQKEEPKLLLPFPLYHSVGIRQHQLKNYDKAIKYLDEAGKFEQENVKNIVARCESRIRNGEIEKAYREAEMAISLNDQDVNALFMKAKALYCMGKFEKALLLSVEGVKARRTPTTFPELIVKITETIEDFLGYNVGEVLLDLEDIIRKMYPIRRERASGELLKQLVAEPSSITSSQTSICEGPKTHQKIESFLEKENFETIIAKRYVGRLADDLTFLRAIPYSQDSDMPQIFKKNSAKIINIANGMHKELKSMQELLQNREPHYLKEYRSAHVVHQLKLRRKIAFLRRRLEAKKMCNKLMQKILEEKNTGNMKTFLETVDKAKDYFDKVSLKLVPAKHSFLETMYDLTGLMYLEQLKLTPDVDEIIHYRDIELYMYTPRIRRNRVDLSYETKFCPFMDNKSILKKSELRLERATTGLERLFLYYEMARTSYDMGYSGVTVRRYAWECLKEAKELNDVPWCINALMLRVRVLVKPYLILGSLNRNRARKALAEAREYAAGLNLKDTVAFIQKCNEVINSGIFKPDKIADREQEIIEMMPDWNTRMEMERLLHQISLEPVERRFSLVPYEKPTAPVPMPKTPIVTFPMLKSRPIKSSSRHVIFKI